MFGKQRETEREFYRKEEEFQVAQRKFETYMNEATYCQNSELIGSMLSFLTIVLCHTFVLCPRKIIYTVLME